VHQFVAARAARPPKRRHVKARALRRDSGVESDNRPMDRAMLAIAPWAQLLQRTFAIEIKCGKCGSPLRLIALIKTREVIEKILVAMHLSADVPELHPARPPPVSRREARGVEDLLN
jgi:hypothetical protein